MGIENGNRDEKRREEKGIKWEKCEDGEMRRGREKKTRREREEGEKKFWHF